MSRDAVLSTALEALRDARLRLEELHEPIAVTGLACRFPGGADDPEAYWAALMAGVDGVGPVPAGRWHGEDAPAVQGGFVEGVDRFDAAFFGISPREAERMDPQQRFLLEVGWEAMEDAGIAEWRGAPRPVGVFVGVATDDYAGLVQKAPPEPGSGAYDVMGTARYSAAGRLSYTFGLTGPSLTVDTACSSSLVAVHLACQALRRGDCDAALAAGVNLVLAPAATRALSGAGMLSAAGRCHTFDRRADGMVRGEGCGVVVLEPLSRALAAGRRVRAVIRGTAVNQDGASAGFTVPHGPSQEAVIRRALEDAGCTPDDVAYVEAHGTGTPLGDPIELRALGRVFAGRAPDRPVVVGSAKSNLGHLEAAAGVAGLVKAVLSLERGVIPPNLHFHEPTPEVEWSRLPIRVPTAPEPLGGADGPARVGISSFGASGTNAHVIVEAAPPPPAASSDPAPSRDVVLLSAHSGAAVRAQAARWADHLASGAASLADAAHTSRVGRASLRWRAAVTAATRDEAVEALRALASGGRAVHEAAGGAVALHFAGTGGGALKARHGADERFRAAVRPLVDALAARLGPAPEAAPPPEAWVRGLEVAHAWGAWAVWRALGVEPARVSGAGVGALAAAAVRGELSPEGAALRACDAAAEGGGGAPAELEGRAGVWIGEGAPAGWISASGAGVDGAAALWERGVRVDWRGAGLPAAGRIVSLPAYAWQRRRFWIASAPAASTPPAPADGARGAVRAGTHPLLGERLELPGSDQVRFESILQGPAVPGVLDEHVVEGRSLFPASGFYELALAAARTAAPDAGVAEMSIERGLSWDEGGRLRLQTVLTPDGGAWRLEIHARGEGAEGAPAWRRHAVAKVVRGGSTAPAERLGAPGIVQELPAGAAHAPGLVLPPLVVDAALLAVAARLEREEGRYLQSGVGRIAVAGGAGEAARVEAWLAADGGDPSSRVLTLRLVDRAGGEVARLQDVLLRHLPGTGAPAGERAPEPWAEWLYTLAWPAVPLPRGAESPLRGVLPALAAEAAERVEAEAARAGLPEYLRGVAALDALAASYVEAALWRGGWRPAPGDAAAAEEVRAAVGAEPRFGRLVARWMEVLADAGVLARAGDGWRVVRPLRDAAGDAPGPVPAAEEGFVRRCGAHLLEVVRGETDPVSLLFPEGSQELAEGLYRASPPSRFTNAVLRHAAARLGRAARAAGTRLRVLEIGAGTGATALALLDALGGDVEEYAFTDLGGLFVARARERFAGDPRVRCQPLDVERDPAAQGFAEGAYDVVVATNVVHATRRLDESLAHARRLLKPGGLLLLAEGTARFGWFDVTFGLTDGWWRFDDAGVRPDYPLVAPATWLRLLARADFGEAVDLLACDAAPRPSAILVARAGGAPAVRRRWLLLGAEDGAAGPLGDALLGAGEPSVRIASPAADGDPRALLHAGPEAPTDVVYCAEGAPGDPLAPRAGDAAERACGGLLDLLHALLAAEGAPPRLWIATRGAQAVRAGEVADPVQATLWGLGKTIALEHPELRPRLVDLCPGGGAEGAAAELAAADGPWEHAAYRQGVRHALRLERRQPPAGPAAPAGGEGAWLITGGLGGIGYEVARWLVAQGARHLALVQRSAPGGEAREALRALESSGARVLCLQADVSDPAQLGQALRRVRAELPPLRGVIHSAGTFQDRLLANHDRAAFRSTFLPKVQGTLNLHALTADDPLEHFVLFSSGASLMGSAGLGNYVAANAFEDALACARRARGLPGLSINWGAWRGTGMAAAVGERREAQWDVMGVEQMDPGAALGAFGALLGGGDAQVAVVAIHWPRFLEQHAGGVWTGFLERFRGTPGPARADVPATAAAVPRGAGPAELRAFLEGHLREQVRRLLGIDPATPVSARDGFFDLGMDSLMSLEFRNRLQASLGVGLPRTLTFRYPTVGALLDHLQEALAAGAPASDAPDAGAAAADQALADAPRGQAAPDPAAGRPGAADAPVPVGVAAREPGGTADASLSELERYIDDQFARLGLADGARGGPA